MNDTCQATKVLFCGPVLRNALRRHLAALACAASLLTAGTGSATDGSWISTVDDWYGSTSRWLGGVVAGGEGATLYSFSGNKMTLPVPAAAGATTNVVLGNLVLADGSATNIASIIMGTGFGQYGCSGPLILDSGAEGTPATIQNNCSSNLTRMFFRCDIRLQSDLSIIDISSWLHRRRNPHTTAYLTGNISEDNSRRGVSVWLAGVSNQVSFFGDNTFSGDVDVQQGGVKAASYTRLGGQGRQFGRDNTVYATNDNSQVDLGGFSFAPDQRLVLAGCGVAGLGVLAASQQSACHTAEWSGPVTLIRDSAVGMGFCSYYPRSVGGALAITGAIDEQGAGRSLIKNSLNTLFLRGTNTYSGGTVISNGYLSATRKENLGTGPLVCAGGAFLFETPWDITSAGVALTNAPGQVVRLRTADQNVTFNGVLGPFSANVWKSGLGTLTLTRTGLHQNFHIWSGAVNLDYTTQAENKLPSAYNVSLYNNASLNIVGGAQAFTNTVNSFSVEARCAGVISVSGAAGTRFNLEGGAAGTINTSSALDLRVQEGTELNLSRMSFDGANMLNSRITLNNGSSFVSKSAGNAAIPYASATSDWDTVTARHVDVTAATPASVPADAKIRTLRFNDPAAGQLTLEGGTSLSNGAILVTTNMGATAVLIQNGTLTSSQNNELTVHQYNTQAVLRISSIVTNTTTGAALTLTKTGPGTLILSDVPNTFSGTINVLGGTLEIESQQAFGATNKAVFVYNGGVLRLRGQQIVGSGANTISFNEAGGKLDVPDSGDAATILPGRGMQTHARLIKTGKGMLTLKAWGPQQGSESFLNIPVWQHIAEEGTLDISGVSGGPRMITGEKLSTLTVKNNAVLRGANFLSGNGATNGGGTPEDEAGAYNIYVDETGGTVDLHGVSVNMGVKGGESYSSDFIFGPGRLTITNSSGTAATANLFGAHFNRFTGVFDGARYLAKPSYGGGVPGGELTVPDGASPDFGSQTLPYTLAIGRLTGAGIFGGKNNNDHAMPPLLVGRDADETFEYAGFLWGTHNSASYTNYPFRYVKTGSNAWRVSGGTNAMTGDFTVRKGTLLVGTNSPGQGAAGALGKARAVVGDEGTLAGDSPALLTDGAYTVGNTLVLGGTAGTPTLGGNQTAGASLFTGALNLTRDVCLHAENTDAPNGVTFSGAVTGPGGITKTGPGTVYLTGTVSNAGPTVVQAGQLVLPGGTAVTNTVTVTAGTDGSGILTVSGNLTLGPGATLAVSEAGTLTRGQTYTLLTWTGTRTGVFAAVTGLPQDWHVGYLADSLVLYYARPGTLIKLL